MTEKLAYDWNFDDQGAGPSINPMENAPAAHASMQQVLADSAGPAPAPPRPSPTLSTLPVGIEVDDTLIREAEIRELTGADEEAIDRVNRNSLKFFDKVLQRGVVSLGSGAPSAEQLKQLYVGDRDSLMLDIRCATFGPELEMVGVRCPGCQDFVDFTVDLSSIERRGLPDGPHTVELRDGRIATVTFPTGEDQEYILDEADATTGQTNTRLLERCLEHIDLPSAGVRVPGSADTALKLGIADRRKILMYLADHAPGPQTMDLSVVHDGCGAEVPLPLTVADVFLDF
ncbi:hypothetical protein ACIOEX_18945 [Streptomyces sp. NPDC087850]|uniref:T4 family baseplate hub assembly chaperone n=1 Tax=Streptomyces sp. NPDC087850 TaxID=3365809 RepID=UPI0038252068